MAPESRPEGSRPVAISMAPDVTIPVSMAIADQSTSGARRISPCPYAEIKTSPQDVTTHRAPGPPPSSSASSIWNPPPPCAVTRSSYAETSGAAAVARPDPSSKSQGGAPPGGSTCRTPSTLSLPLCWSTERSQATQSAQRQSTRTLPPPPLPPVTTFLSRRAAPSTGEGPSICTQETAVTAGMCPRGFNGPPLLCAPPLGRPCKRTLLPATIRTCLSLLSACSTSARGQAVAAAGARLMPPLVAVAVASRGSGGPGAGRIMMTWAVFTSTT
mmetsp:Transcript_61273/g.138667  ORF Transcript_61273/g.138667 Transcript_61273/m.138667 type:complete len:272 (+) Transcript_61273:696-1511(+)